MYYAIHIIYFGAHYIFWCTLYILVHIVCIVQYTLYVLVHIIYFGAHYILVHIIYFGAHYILVHIVYFGAHCMYCAIHIIFITFIILRSYRAMFMLLRTSSFGRALACSPPRYMCIHI